MVMEKNLISPPAPAQQYESSTGMNMMMMTMTMIQSVCDWIHLPLLPSYITYTVLTFLAYQMLYVSIGPAISGHLFPETYRRLVGTERLDWDIHVVSFTQASLVSVLGLGVVLLDGERKRMDGFGRIWGWTEPTARVLAIANGYFYWHLITMLRHRRTYGWAMVGHGFATASLMTFGFRPAFMTYAPAAFLYEFSNIFLNVHRALLKMRMEGSPIHKVNGVALFVSFLLTRIVWGTYTTVWAYLDIWTAFHVTDVQMIPAGEVLPIPTWLLAIHVLSLSLLQSLNCLWFYKIARLVLKKVLGGGAAAAAAAATVVDDDDDDDTAKKKEKKRR